MPSGKRTAAVWLGVILVIIATFALGFLFFSGVYWLVAWAFDWTFSWKYSFGAWIVWTMLYQLFQRTVNVKQSCR